MLDEHESAHWPLDPLKSVAEESENVEHLCGQNQFLNGHFLIIRNSQTKSRVQYAYWHY